MDIPTASLIGAIALPSLALLYKLIPTKPGEARGILKDADLARLDDRVKLYERVATVESNQVHQAELLQGLKSDNGIIFRKIDDLKDLLLKEKS